jgi:hypothetical protein
MVRAAYSLPPKDSPVLGELRVRESVDIRLVLREGTSRQPRHPHPASNCRSSIRYGCTDGALVRAASSESSTFGGESATNPAGLLVP